MAEFDSSTLRRGQSRTSDCEGLHCEDEAAEAFLIFFTQTSYVKASGGKKTRTTPNIHPLLRHSTLFVHGRWSLRKHHHWIREHYTVGMHTKRLSNKINTSFTANQTGLPEEYVWRASNMGYRWEWMRRVILWIMMKVGHITPYEGFNRSMIIEFFMFYHILRPYLYIHSIKYSLLVQHATS